MKKKCMGIQEALRLWEMKTPLAGVHLTKDELYSVSEGNASGVIYVHLAVCRACRRRLSELQEVRMSENRDGALTKPPALGHKPIDSYVLPLAASVGVPEDASWVTSDGRYRIEWKVISVKQKKYILQVCDLSSEPQEGIVITVTDANGRELLQGTMDEGGKIARLVHSLDSLDLSRIDIKVA